MRIGGADMNSPSSVLDWLKDMLGAETLLYRVRYINVSRTLDPTT